MNVEDPSARTDEPRLVARYGRSFASGEVFFTEGEPAREAFLLQGGRVRLIKRVGAMDRSLRLVTPGDLFGESALVAGTMRRSTAVAVESGMVLVLDPVTFQQVLAQHPAVGSHIVEQVLRRLRDAEDQIEILMVRDAQAKVVVALLKLARQIMATSDQLDGPVTLAISPIDLATRVGLDVETVKRNVQQLRSSDYIRIVDERIEVPEPFALQELLDLLGTKEHLTGDPGR